MEITEVKIENGGLWLKTSSPEARKFVYGFKAGDYEIIKARKRRSLDANAYAWILIDQIAAAVREPPETVYKKALADVGGISEVICIQEKAKETFKRLFVSGHIGRRVDEQPSKLDGCVTLICYYGSSDFDTKQMARFIDCLVQDARQLGIETDTGRIKSLLEEWDGK
jgi:hypothetical protein